jgi:hypothetical protein
MLRHNNRYLKIYMRLPRIDEALERQYDIYYEPIHNLTNLFQLLGADNSQSKVYEND